ncbi:histidine phosphatase family protein [Tropicibacter oceani]|uniref:Histidine phosphatase family protein n=1 Tax=Tropicibacter oceani TaxID=3058420 RepID=A0ABY8QGZ6_9RHOB|nr:histidine phosphatase family protein [Tropicibacter oceani]WGW03072.1 histidine phosphatase family protein [Tropicibacter oceani]
MAVTLLRHTTPDVTKGTCYGMTDLALADSFAAEAAQVMASLPEVQVIQSSPLLRCLRLAQHIAARASLEVQVVSDWREMDFGTWEGRAWADLPRQALDDWAADFHGYDGHGGESVAQLFARVQGALARAPRDALIVTHMGCIKAALAAQGDPKGWDAQLPFGALVRLQ